MKQLTLLLSVLCMSFSSYAQILLSENFDDITTLTDWDQINVSSPVGPGTWFQGNSAQTFPSYNGSADSYLGGNYQATDGAGTISLWAIFPVLSLKDGDVLTFYTRTVTGSAYPDRLQVRASTDGATSTPPTNVSDLGSYTNLLLEINASQTVGGYPDADWALQTVTISGIGSTAVDTRLAFRYYVTNGGPSGSNSNYIGIDAVEVNQTLSIDDYTEPTGYQVTCNNLYISIYNINNNLNYKVLTINGQTVLEGNTNLNTHTIDATSLSSGIYILEMYNPITHAVFRKKVALN